MVQRLPVATARIGRLEDELAAITSGGSRPAKVSPDGGERRIVKHTAREPALEVLNEVVQSLERLRNDLPAVVPDATAPLVAERQAMLDGQAMLWGQAKAKS